MKDLLKNYLEIIKHRLWEISDSLYHHPELGDQEFESSKQLIEFLEEHKFVVEKGIVGRATAFKAVYDSKKEGPTIAYLSEYDALPEVGHGCGHNLIGTMSAGAGALLSKVLDEIGGRVVVLGTPAEETNGAKVPMAEQGIFDDIDAAMILHPADESYESGDSLAMDAIQFDFRGRTSHAAASPEMGINALDAVIQLFNGINALRQHVTSDVRIHGIIKEGGVAANIVPDKAVAQFYVRAKDRTYLNEVVQKVINIAKGASLMTGAEVHIENYELSYDNMVTNQALSQLFTDNLLAAGVKQVKKAKDSYGSIDMGNVSHVVPAIHPYIGLDSPGLIAHTREFADLTITDNSHQILSRGALALALTGFDLITNKEALEKMKNEFRQTVVGNH
ncbi:M20 family metallopeptidase [Bacillus sp. ISL-40]|uniref:M20 family metallopeptidase n=1 Tax=unclassified Bacillus (in: firmicutes) TaxID=185979 RepID=UPI001BE60419|nr:MULTISPECIES: M20 family metallopeptidase [unclassified Bacillus (in: firmicutes)]MBT2698678.1 M20 family metallopeptidase [Bacillus sp. ISL-40]MBT2724822.1 M20 family metallopeptidase [Bacillus sp. ISL-46]MBT2743521.1 M20 family metallopeptidase [Bacillus sp. ISL-77]